MRGYERDERLNLYRREGFEGIAYSDGRDVELRLLDIVRNAGDKSVFSEELRRGISDWPSEYHLSRKRHSIARILGIQPGEDVLEVGCGCGAITRFLGEEGANVTAIDGSCLRAQIAAERCVDLPNVSVVAEDLARFEATETYDWILLIGVLEYAPVFNRTENAMKAYLDALSPLLKQNGRIVIAIENKLGLKYFNGCSEDHLGTKFTNIQGLYGPGQPKTLGRREMEKLLQEVNLPHVEFLYPFPDYKLPQSILREAAFTDPEFRAEELLARSYARDYSDESIRLFLEPLVARELVRNDALPHFANSFLIIASPRCPDRDDGILAETFAFERRQKFATVTSFRRDESGIHVNKLPVQANVERARSTGQFTLRQIIGSSEYILGELALWSITKLRAGDPDCTMIAEAFLPWFDFVISESRCAEGNDGDALRDYLIGGRHQDCTPFNLIDSNGRFIIIDEEWSIDGDIELGWCVTRSVFATLLAMPGMESKPISPRDVIVSLCEQRKLSVSDEDIKRWLNDEAEFQRSVSGTHSEGFDIGQKTAPILSLKSWTRQLQESLSEREVLIRAVGDALNRCRAENESLAAEKESLAAEKESLAAEMESLAAEREGLAAEMESLAAGKESLAAEVECLRQALQQKGEALVLIEAQVDDLYRSQSWRATAPLRLMTTGGRSGMRKVKQAGWRAVRGLYRSLPLSQGTKQKLRGALARRTNLVAGVTATQTHPLSIEPTKAPATREKPDVFIWAVIDWHFRIQRPQHLARAFANRGHRTFYFSGHFVDAAEPGFRIEPVSENDLLHIVYLQVPGAPAIYFRMPPAEVEAAIAASLGLFLQWAEPREILSMVQHPFWKPFADRVPNRKIIYDLMDHHEGFEDNAPDVIAAGHALLREADRVIVTSTFLEEVAKKSNPHVSMVRNAGEYRHFAQRPAEVYRDEQGRRIIGYYGAIAEWFDLDLVERLAREQPNDCILLIGADTAKAKERLAGCPNVLLTGEVKYSELPFYLYAFDVCILPFKVIPLTLATNPVKVYEYLSAGKAVVSIDLPEISQFGDLVARAKTHDEFITRVAEALDDAGDAASEAERRRFASEQTWDHRVESFAKALEETQSPRASVIIVTYNNLAFTKACLFSLERDTAYDDFEIIVVDNASSDGTPDYLREWESGGVNRIVVLNEDNRGFAAANNQGITRATGEYLVLLNNDTVVTPGWLGSLVAHLKRNPLLGLVGPVTNNIGNEARIDIHYSDMLEMRQKALSYTSERLGQLHPSANVAFFCVAFTRQAYNAIGDLDEDFGVGFFEDDDYCRRAEALGLHVAIADDVFIHHHLSASFDALAAERKRELFEKNRIIYEAKWGPWTPHQYRSKS